MTCNLAFSYDRDVYALPGRIDDPRSQGCNELIRKKVAEPVTSLQGLIGSLGMDNKTDQSIPSPIKRLTSHYGAHVSSDELKFMGRILETVQRHRGIMIEDLAEATGSTYRKTAETASLLEIDGFITIDLLQRCCINPKNV